MLTAVIVTIAVLFLLGLLSQEGGGSAVIGILILFGIVYALVA